MNQGGWAGGEKRGQRFKKREIAFCEIIIDVQFIHCYIFLKLNIIVIPMITLKQTYYLDRDCYKNIHGHNLLFNKQESSSQRMTVFFFFFFALLYFFFQTRNLRLCEEQVMKAFRKLYHTEMSIWMTGTPIRTS